MTKKRMLEIVDEGRVVIARSRYGHGMAIEIHGTREDAERRLDSSPLYDGVMMATTTDLSLASRSDIMPYTGFWSDDDNSWDWQYYYPDPH